MLALAARYLCLAREHRLSPSLSRSSSSPHSCRSVHRAEAEFAFLVRAALVLCWLRGCRSCASRRSSSLPALSLPLSLSLSLLGSFVYLFVRERGRARTCTPRASVRKRERVIFSEVGENNKQNSWRDTDILAQFGARLRATIWNRVKSGRASGGFIFKGCTVISAASLTAGPLAKQWRTQERPV